MDTLPNHKRAAIVLLTFLMIAALALSGCGRSDNPDDNNRNAGGGVENTDSSEEAVDDGNSENAVPHGEYLELVNRENALDSGYVPGDLVDLDAVQVREDVAQAFTDMKSAAREDGLDFYAYSGFRSYETQNTIYNNVMEADPEQGDTYSAKPGHSEHQTGLAIDIKTPDNESLRDFSNTPEAEWVRNNAHRFGFIVRYTEANLDITGYMSEPWHVRYIGVEHATNIYENQISSFEEYLNPEGEF